MHRFIFLLVCLGMINQAQSKPYKGAEIYTHQSYLYGRYEMRMRAAKAGAVLSTFFTYKNNSQLKDSFWEEIDIEIFGKGDANEWQSNIILGKSSSLQHSVENHKTTESLASAYHIYVLEWTPDYIAWFFDGTEVRRITDKTILSQLTNPQTARFNLWASDSQEWAGTWDGSLLPVYQFVDYFEYKTYNTKSRIFEAGWRDDFDKLDISRWGKANWTFDTNRVDFVPENVLVKNGILVLALTHENATGYSGTTPTDK
jgi:endo-1,3-1,4-beta-glycanase ExoK